MSQRAQSAAACTPAASIAQTIAQLAQAASIEINVHDVKHLEASRAFLAPGTRVFVSFLPKQSWQDTQATCRAVRAAGFDPVPHIPVRLVADEAMLDRNLAELVGGAQVQEVLLIAGDYAQTAGPYATVSQVLQGGLLGRHGLKKVSVAGHPEGHPQVALDEIRRSERDKAALGADAGLDVALVTQVIFEHAPFLQWAGELRADGVRSRIVAGLAGPASITTLFKFAMRCGAGASVRALGARPTSMLKIIGERGPEDVVRGLAEARAAGRSDFSGFHLFCFGGYLRSCEWLHKVAGGRFTLDDSGSFSA
jgi:methylenetetrahydrofolate reductase (NADPH)